MKNFLKRKILDPLLQQLKKGVTPQKLAMSSAFGLAVGVFPIYPTTTVVGIIIGFIFRLNHIALQVVNYAAQGLQFLLIPVYMHWGDKMFGITPFSFSIDQIKKGISENPKLFFNTFGGSIWHGVVLWLITAPFIVGLTYFAILPLFKKWTLKNENK